MPKQQASTAGRIALLLALVAALLATKSFANTSSSGVYIKSELASPYLVTGESTYLKVSIQNVRQAPRPAAPVIPNTAVNFARNMVEIDSRRRITHSYVYRLRPAKPGTYTVPPVTIFYAGRQYSSQKLQFEVVDPGELTRVSTGRAGQDVLVGWFPKKTTLYVGEQCPLTLKIYVPTSLRPSSWGLPEPDKKNCLAWRFEAPSRDNISELVINNANYIAGPFKTTLSGISPGTATFGPTRLKIVSRQRRIDPRRGIVISDIPVGLSLPAINFDILPLPPNAPAGFNGAVGQFNLAAECKKAAIKDTDTLEVFIQVEGEGNLENIQVPELTGKGWKVIDSSKMERGGERRQARGAVTFRQILRPEPSPELPTAIPPYALSFFNPDNKSYYTLTTSPMPVTVIDTLGNAQPADNKSPTPIDPVAQRPEQMSDILGFITQPDTATSAERSSAMAWRSWQLIPALLCLAIIMLPLLKKIREMRERNSGQRERKHALREIAQTTDAEDFYRRAGHFIDTWLEPDDELKAVLAERDRHCFSPGDRDDKAIEEERKQQILELLKRHLQLVIVTLITGMALLCPLEPLEAAEATEGQASQNAPVSLSEAQAALEDGNYRKALKIYQEQYPEPSQTPSDILYNMGNCHYHLDQPGHAALCWRRALAVDPTHPQARQNLRFLELKEGAAVPVIQPWQEKLTTLPLSGFHYMAYGSLWVLLICVLVMGIIRPKRPLAWFICALIMPFTMALGGLGMLFYPDSDARTPFDEQAVCLKATRLHTEAHRDSEPGMSLAPGSLLTVKARRGSWWQVSTGENQSGWIQKSSVALVVEPES
ncbi:MAG: BatD family protein [Akkermansiaceae bacterium]